MAMPLVIPLNTSAASSVASDPFFGSLITSMDNSGWTVNFGDGATQTATTGDRGGNSLISDPTKAVSPYPVNIPQNSGSIGTPTGTVSNGTAQKLTGSAIPWNLVLMFGGAAALILLWKKR